MNERIQNALKRIACNVPRHMLNIERRFDDVAVRLVKTDDGHAGALQQVASGIETFKTWCEQTTIPLDGAQLEAMATTLERNADALDELLYTLEEYCTQQGQ